MSKNDDDFMVISTYTVQEAINDGVLVPVFQKRWDQLSGGTPIVATSHIMEELSLAAVQEIWNEFVSNRKKKSSGPFVTKMNNKTIWVVDDGQSVTILFPEDY